MEGSAFTRAIDALVRVIYLICCALLVWLITITGMQVFGRYVLNDSPVWVERAALLTILYIAFPMAAVGVRQGFHMSVTFAVDDADATAAKATELGGTVIVPPLDAPWVRMTIINDPHGATFIASKFAPENKDL